MLAFALPLTLISFVIAPLVVSSCHVSLPCLCGLPWVFYTLGETCFILGPCVRSLYYMFSCKSIHCPHRLSVVTLWRVIYPLFRPFSQYFVAVSFMQFLWTGRNISLYTFIRSFLIGKHDLLSLCISYLCCSEVGISEPLYASRQIRTRLSAYAIILAVVVNFEYYAWPNLASY